MAHLSFGTSLLSTGTYFNATRSPPLSHRAALWAAACASISMKLLPKETYCPKQGTFILHSRTLQEKRSFHLAVSAVFHQSDHNSGSVSVLDANQIKLLISVIVVYWGSWKLAEMVFGRVKVIKKIKIPNSKSVRKFPQWIAAENKHVFVLPENQQD